MSQMESAEGQILSKKGWKVENIFCIFFESSYFNQTAFSTQSALGTFPCPASSFGSHVRTESVLLRAARPN